MKKYKYLLLIVFICLAATVIWAADGTYTTGFYIQQGGDRAVVASGGSLDVESGGEIDIESGGSLKIAGTAVTSTAAELNKLASLSGDVLSTTNTKTVTNKTLSGATFTGTIAGGTFTGSTLTTPIIASLYQASGTNLLTMPAATDTLVGKATTDTFTNKTLSGATFTGTITGGTFTNSTMTTPTIASIYQSAGQLMTLPNTASDTLAALAATQVFTNKTLSGATFTGTIDGGTFTNSTLTSPAINTATITGGSITSTTLSGNTLTNATVTAPVLATFYQDAGKTQLMTAPNTASDTLAAIAATQTLTNKTLTSPVINFGISPKTFTAGEDWTLSASEAKSMLLTLASGSGTPSIIDDYSTAGAMKIIRNAANVAVTCKMSGQTGVSVASGTTAVLINSGADYVRVTADATH